MNFLDVFFLSAILFAYPNPSITTHDVRFDLDKVSEQLESRTGVRVYPYARLWVNQSESGNTSSCSIDGKEDLNSRYQEIVNFGIWDMAITYSSGTMMRIQILPTLSASYMLKFETPDVTLSFFNDHIRSNTLNQLSITPVEELSQVDESNGNLINLAMNISILRETYQLRRFRYSISSNNPTTGGRFTWVIFSSGDYKARCVDDRNLEIITQATIDGSFESTKFVLIFRRTNERLEFFNNLKRDESVVYQVPANFNDADCTRDTTYVIDSSFNTVYSSSDEDDAGETQTGYSNGV